MSDKYPAIVFPAGSTGPLTHHSIPGVEIWLVVVTPEFSEYILKRNSENQRNQSKPSTNTYASDMDNDFWAFLGDPIRFDIDGVLVDGQHRAKAVIRSGKPQTMAIVLGLDRKAMRQIDTGRKRSYADTIRMDRDVPNHVGVAATIAAMWYWYSGSYGDKNVPRLRNTVYSDRRPSNAQLDRIYDLLLDNELDPVASVREAMRIKQRIISRCPLTAISVAHMLLGHIDPYTRDTFFTDVYSMDASKNTSAEYPPNLLRDRMMRSAEGNTPSASDTMTRAQWLHLWISAYNGWAAGKTMGNLRKPSIPVKPESWAYPDGMKEVATLEAADGTEAA
jgi:hypothetical protein